MGLPFPSRRLERSGWRLKVGQHVVLGLRPEHFHLRPDRQ
jgi:hypothetical protein